MKELSDYAAGKGIAIGGYSLLASRGAKEQDAAISHKTGKPAKTREEGSRFGVSPCIASDWGDTYFRKLQNFFTTTGMNVFENDGSYPGDPCASTSHSGHKGYLDSQWKQWKKINRFYRWCRANGVYLNVPDWYFLSGSNKTPMGYVETNWSLPRAYQEIIERQNIYDGTWQKTPSMGFMFVPLTQYHGVQHRRQGIRVGIGFLLVERAPRPLRNASTEPLRDRCASLLPWSAPLRYGSDQRTGQPMGCFL